MKKIVTIFILTCICHFADIYAQGLKFVGMESPIEQRTSYRVFDNRIPSFNDLLVIEFKMSMYMPSDFGYILRVKNNNDKRIFNLLYQGPSWDKAFPIRLNEEGKSSVIKASLPHEYFEMGKWMNVCLTFEMNKGKVILEIDDYKYEADIAPLATLWKPEICFGRSDYMIDVPSVAIKDLIIRDNRKSYHFPLNETEGTKVHETEGKRYYGNVSNPVWLLQKSHRWDEVAVFTSNKRSGINYDKYRKSVYYFNTDSIYVYDLIGKSSYSIRYDQDCPVELYLGSSFVHPGDSSLYVYEPYKESKESDTPTVASYDIISNKWQIRSYDSVPVRLHHHSSYIDETRNKFVFFGGFGNMIYNNDFYSYDFNEGIWSCDTEPDGDVIHPRYFTSVGYSKDNDNVYIFGGMGNESGEQIVGRHYFYDLHKIDLKNNRNEIIWGKDLSLAWNEENMVPVRNMILNGDDFYTMCYPEFHTNSHLQLYCFNIPTATYKKFCDKIPIRSDKMATNANLYFDKELRLLILTVMESSDDIKSRLRIYTLSFPPLSEDDYQAITERSNVWEWILILISVLILGAGGWIFLSHNKKHVDNYIKPKGRKRYITEQPANSICLFGGFSAIDNNGNTVSFPHQQKKLLCLILKYSLDKGISSDRLSKIMWPDKSEEKVKNSRGVAMNHLRKLLENFNGLTLVFEDTRFKLLFSETFYCDWVEFKRESSLEHPDMGKIMSIVARGKFLPFVDDSTFDSFKEKTESKLISLLSAELIRNNERKQYGLVLDIADIIFYTDSLNEQALICQINALVKMHRSEDAMVRYADFVKEYKAMYGADYEHDFKHIIK